MELEEFFRQGLEGLKTAKVKTEEVFDALLVQQTDSTMDLVRSSIEWEKLLEAGAVLFTEVEGQAPIRVVLAHEQKTGRGQRGRDWNSDAGKGFYGSIRFSPEAIYQKGATSQSLDNTFSAYSLLGGLSVLRALESFDISLGLKWPNDVLEATPPFRKLSGILVESSLSEGRLDELVIGIGLNLYSSSFSSSTGEKIHAVSLEDLLGERIEFSEFVFALFSELLGLSRKFFSVGFPDFAKEWGDKSLFQGELVRVGHGQKQLQGLFRGVDERGRMLVQTEGGMEVVVSSGQLEFPILSRYRKD